jgi:hypothetical protein
MTSHQANWKSGHDWKKHPTLGFPGSLRAMVLISIQNIVKIWIPCDYLGLLANSWYINESSSGSFSVVRSLCRFEFCSKYNWYNWFHPFWVVWYDCVDEFEFNLLSKSYVDPNVDPARFRQFESRQSESFSKSGLTHCKGPSRWPAQSASYCLPSPLTKRSTPSSWSIPRSHFDRRQTPTDQQSHHKLICRRHRRQINHTCANMPTAGTAASLMR